MRLNNRARVGAYRFFATLILVLFIIGCVVFLLEILHLKVLTQWLGLILIGVSAVLGIIFVLRGRPIFEYDSDGEALHLKNSHILPFSKALNDEFPKYKMLSFEVIDAVILRRLYVRISSRKNHPIILKYDISYLKEKEVQDLRTSLNKLIRTNQENRESRS